MYILVIGADPNKNSSQQSRTKHTELHAILSNSHTQLNEIIGINYIAACDER
jgi:hypothetical protein